MRLSREDREDESTTDKNHSGAATTRRGRATNEERREKWRGPRGRTEGRSPGRTAAGNAPPTPGPPPSPPPPGPKRGRQRGGGGQGGRPDRGSNGRRRPKQRQGRRARRNPINAHAAAPLVPPGGDMERGGRGRAASTTARRKTTPARNKGRARHGETKQRAGQHSPAPRHPEAPGPQGPAGGPTRGTMQAWAGP